MIQDPNRDVETATAKCAIVLVVVLVVLGYYLLYVHK